MDPPPVEPIVPLAPISPAITPQETLEVLGNEDLMRQIAGSLSRAETTRLERTSRQIREAVRTTNQERLAELTNDPRVQQAAVFLRNRYQQPIVRSGIIPGYDLAPALAGPTADTERLVTSLGNFAEVPTEEQRRAMLDFRWTALRYDDPTASRPNLVDRLGNPIDRGRSTVTPQDDADRPDVQRRVPDTPLEQLADRGVAVIDRRGHIINAPVRRS